MNVDGDRVGMIEFSGKRAFDVADTLTIFDFSADKQAREDATNAMDNLEGQTWTLMGIQKAVEAFQNEDAINSEDRNRVLALVTDGRPKPRTTASDAPGDTSEPGCITTMLDTGLPICNNGEAPGTCRNPLCADIN